MAISLVDFISQTTDQKRAGLVQIITNKSQLMPRLKWIMVDGFSYTYNRQQTTGGIAFRGLNEDYAPDAGVINPLVEQLAIFGGKVQTDRQIVNKQGDIARANSIAGKVKRSSLFFDKYCIQGDPANDPRQFYGLNARLTGRQYITCGANGGALTLDILDAALDRVIGGNNEGKVIVCNKACRRTITDLLRATASGTRIAEIQGQAASYDGVPFAILDEDGDDQPILTETEVMGSSSATTSLYVIKLGDDTDGEYVQGLMGSQLIEHVQVGLLGTYYVDLIEANVGIAIFHPRAACRVAGIIPNNPSLE